MTDLRKAAEMALEFCEDIGSGTGPYPYVNETAVVSDSRKVLQALRQALAQPEQKIMDCVYPKCETTGGCNGPCSKPLYIYTAPVDAINMSQERVDETAKGEHKPVAWFIQYEDSHEFVWSKPDGWRMKQALEIQPLYTAPPQKEWVGLTDEEVIKCFDSVAFGQVEDDLIINKHVNIFRAIHGIEARLKEKNT